MKPYLQLLGFGLFAAAGNLLGGYLITRSRARGRRELKYLIAIGAGFMLGVVFLEVLPEVAEHWRERAAVGMGWVLAGYLILQLAEHTAAPHFHFGEETHRHEILRRGAATRAIAAMSIHTFFDGVAIASGLLTSFRLGVVLFLAVLLHKVPEGFTVASIALSSGRSAGAAWRATLLISAATLAGIIVVALAKPSVQYALPLSAGVTLYVAASDLIPEVNQRSGHGAESEDDHHQAHPEGGTRTSLMVFAGVALFYLTHLLLHAALGE